jgi:hypothetical protein
MGIAFVVFSPALGGEMFSDDALFLSENPYIQELSLPNLVALFDPTSPASLMIGAYSPVALLVHAGGWQFFGDHVTGHHAINIALHALGSALLVFFLIRCGISKWAAGFGGLVFLVHPANVEAVAWISQLKTSSCFVFALLALFTHPRRPLLSLVFFALALLAKPTGATVFFVVLTLGYVHASRPAESRNAEDDWRWTFMAAWLVVLLAYAMAYVSVFSQSIPNIPPLYEDLGVRLRSIAAVGLRYLVMAATGYGTGAFHEPPGARSLLDPWWLSSLAVLLAMVWRIVVVFRRRSVELAFWVWPASWYAVVCGIVPIPFPIADRHLYFMLPGLIGIACFVLADIDRWLESRSVRTPSRVLLRNVGIAAGAVLTVAFAAQSYEVSKLYGQPERLYELAADRYPDGTVARQMRAREAAWRGDVDATLSELRGMRIQYGPMLFELLADPTYEGIRQDPRFQSFITELARAHIEELDDPQSQLALRQLAFAHMILGDQDAAERAIRRGLELEGPIREQLRADLDELARAREGGQF